MWGRPIDDTSKAVGRDAFARDVTMTLKGQTNVAIFGPRDTGKTTFATQLAQELRQDHGADAPPHVVVKVNFQRAFSIPACIGAVHDALMSHPERRIQREARRQITAMEKEIGFDIKVIKGAVKRSGVTPQQDAEAFHAQLFSMAKLGDHVVVILDEFQRLNRCPESPLSIIRSALMSGGANHLSLLLTGSIREALKMMLEKSDEPIFGEVAQMELPPIEHVDFLEFLDFNFQATERPATEEALNYLLHLSERHPKRTQQLAWTVWRTAKSTDLPIQVDLVERAHDEMLEGSDLSEFETTLGVLGNGGEGENNELRALFLLAERGGGSVTSRENVALYGFTSHARIPDALDRLRRRGLAQRRGDEWVMVDPLFAQWLRRQSPLQLRPEDL